MKILALTVFSLHVLTGLNETPIGPVPPPGSPRVMLGDLRHADDPKFSKKERAILSAAYQYVELQDKTPFDAYYKITSSSKGYSVYIQFTKYNGNTPVFMPGGFCEVLLDKTGKVIHVYRGL